MAAGPYNNEMQRTKRGSIGASPDSSAPVLELADAVRIVRVGPTPAESRAGQPFQSSSARMRRGRWRVMPSNKALKLTDFDGASQLSAVLDRATERTR